MTPKVAAVTVSAVMTVKGSNIECSFLNGCSRFRVNLITEKGKIKETILSYFCGQEIVSLCQLNSVTK